MDHAEQVREVLPDAALHAPWRAIEIVADNLESSLDVVFSGDIQNTRSNPLSLDGKTGRLRAGLQWDSPLTRMQERNQYRQVLIEYQQAKRNYYRYEDAVWQTLRGEIRNLRYNQYNFELQRYAVRIAAQQISINEDLRQIRESLSLASGPTAARDSVSALQDLLNAQNTFLGVWVFYEAQRRNLDQDLGTIQVDSENIWVDPGAITSQNLGFGPTAPEVIIEQEMLNAIPNRDEPILAYTEERERQAAEANAPRVSRMQPPSEPVASDTGPSESGPSGIGPVLR